MKAILSLILLFVFSIFVFGVGWFLGLRHGENETLIQNVNNDVVLLAALRIPDEGLERALSMREQTLWRSIGFLDSIMRERFVTSTQRKRANDSLGRLVLYFSNQGNEHVEAIRIQERTILEEEFDRENFSAEDKIPEELKHSLIQQLQPYIDFQYVADSDSLMIFEKRAESITQDQ